MSNGRRVTANAIGEEITDAKLLDRWYDAAATYLDGTRDDSRRAFDMALARADKVFTPQFTDEAIEVFNTAGIISDLAFASMVAAIRQTTGNDRARHDQKTRLIAELLDSGEVPTKEPPAEVDAFEDSKQFIRERAKNVTEAGLLDRWAAVFEITTARAKQLLQRLIERAKALGALNSDFEQFVDMTDAIAQLPDDLTDWDLSDPNNPVPP